MPTNLSPSDSQNILRLHNDYRATNGIVPLTWSDTVATKAIEWATVSASYPGCVRPDNQGGAHGGNGNYGQNLAWGSSQFSNEVLVGLWSSEPIPMIPVGSGPNSYNHASQMLWGSTTSVGCAIGYGNGCKMLVCEYNPAGNMVGQQWNTVGGRTSSSVQVTGIGMDRQLYSKNGLNGPWSKVASRAELIDLIQVPGNGFVGVAPDYTLWIASSLTGSWSYVPNSGSVKSIALLNDKVTYVGVGLDSQLWIRAGLNGYWRQVMNSGSVFDVTVLLDGRILGVGMDYQLYIKQDLNAKWVLIPNSGAVTRTTQQSDGSIIGVGMDNALWRMQTLGTSWTYVPNSRAVLSVVTY